ncbi:unnamed protein product, partial [Iphiclides podalirius]
MFCPDGLYFNPKTLQCDWKQNVICSTESLIENEQIPEDAEVYENDSREINNSKVEDDNVEDNPNEREKSDMEFLENGCPVDSNVHWLLPHENDCNLFYYCVWGKKVQQKCPSTLHFNKKLQVCDWPEDAGCVKSSEETSGGDSSEADTSEVDASEEDTPEVDSPDMDTSEEDTSEVDTPEVDSSKEDSTEVENPGVNSSELDPLELLSSKKIETVVDVKI